MYAIAMIRYRKEIERVLEARDEHRAYLRDLKERGVLVASGPLEPRYGGFLLLRLPEGDGHEALDAIRDGDPYVRAGVAQYETWLFRVGIGKDDLDRIP